MSLTAAALAFLLQAQAAPAPDPKDWWAAKVERPSPEREPLAGRRLAEGAILPAVDNGVEPLLYRLWGLQPLQNQILERGEMVIELWRRPSRRVEQTVIRVTVRRDGRAFVQARAGLGCCSPEIGRRVDVDAELASAEPFRGLPSLPAWDTPRRVVVLDGEGSVSSICLDGTSWDVTLVTTQKVRHLRRACDSAEIGQIADILTPLVSAALARDPRIDVLFPNAADFSAERRAYDAVIAAGGRLEAAKAP
jgi:hypothetical protein